MKKYILTLVIIALSTIAMQVKAQSPSPGYWVIEHNKKQPRVQTVRFYNDWQQLIYAETVNGKININRKKTQEKLNSVLDSLVKNNTYARNNNVLAAALK